MNNEFKNLDKLRKCKARENETPDQREVCLAQEREQKHQKELLNQQEKHDCITMQQRPEQIE
ncbi:30712_t:CDS:2, partial [Racocetra persica]